MNTKILKYSKNSIQIMKRSLLNGDVAIIPTDTVYGIAALAKNKKAVDKVFRIKKRPKSMPLIIFVKSLNDAKKIAHFSKLDIQLAKHFWPGSLTLILNKKTKNIYYGDRRLKKIGVRIPNNRVVKALLNAVKKPLATTSANIHNEANVKNISNLSILRNKDLKSAIEDRKNMSFTESTIIATHENNFKILRKGKVKISEIRKVVKDEN